MYLVFGLCLSNFGASLQVCKSDMTHITSFRNVICMEHTATAVFVAFWPVLPFRERKNFIRLS